MKKTLLTILVLTIFVNSWAATYYVDPSASGTNSGTLANPWQSISAINQSILSPGDQVLFKRGQKYSGTLTITKSGTSGNPITFGAYGTGADPMFYGTGSTITSLFYMNNRSYITFYGLTIKDTTISATDRTIQSKIQRGFYVDGTSNNIVIRKCTLDRVGVGAYFVGPNNTIDSCDMGNMRMVVNDNTNPDNDYGANPVVISSANNTITNSYFHDCWATSFDYQYDGGAVEFYGDGASNNFIAYNTFYDCNGVVENGSGNGGTITGNKFCYNEFINNGSLFYVNNGGSFAVTVSNMQFYNNTIIETAMSRLNETYMCGMRTTVSTSGVCVFQNNVFWLQSGVALCRSGQFNGVQLTHTNNIYRLSGGSVLNFTADGSETSTSAGIATLWQSGTGNPITWNLKPAGSSPLINYGVAISGLSQDKAGNKLVGLPDAGAYEYTTVTSVRVLSRFVNGN